ncbi:MAG: hypothetical protein RL186_304 [Pseudomonadota bacterium]
MAEAEQASVLVQRHGALGRLTLNRPAALHALNLEMVSALTQALLAWRADDGVTAVVIDHAGPRGFCAGGDIAMLARSGAGDSGEARAFFHAEYRLNHLLHTYAKPVIAVMDGVTMGGGVGISIPARFRIATPRTLFAMPETGIGLFPDVGGGWFLPRLKDQIGIWLALTGTRLKAADTMAAGLATHFLDDAALEGLIASLIRAAQDGDPVRALTYALAHLQGEAGPPAILDEATRATIARTFDKDSVEDVVAALAGEGTQWSHAQLNLLATKSPQTLKVALRQMRLGARAQTFAEVMAMEYRIGSRVVSLHDFQEGVRAVIIDKDNRPVWRPSSLSDVTDAYLDPIFAPLPPQEEWTPLP